MKAIDFVVRTGMGAVQRGEVAANNSTTTVDVASGSEISLHLRQFDVSAYQRSGNDLQVVLADGRTVVLENYFTSDGARLFISAGGFLNEVTLVEGDGGTLYAQYGPTEEWGKWSPTEELIFVDDGHVMGPDFAGRAGDDEVSMLGAGLLAGSGLWGAGAAAAAGAAVIAGGGGGDGGGGGGGSTYVAPTVNEDGMVVITGGDDPKIEITGTADPDSEVEVVIGNQTLVTHSDQAGNWGVTFEGDTFPTDGEYDVRVHVVEPNGTETDLDGPNILIDTTAPEVEFTDGTQSTGVVVNAEDHSDGVDISGTSEPGADLVVVCGGAIRELTVGEDGTWSVSYTREEIVTGEYETEISVTATDQYGNSETYTDVLVVDTVPHDITINASSIEGDGVVNAAEAADGVTITGTSTAGATMTVTVQGMTQTATVAADGTWSVDFSTLAPGEYDVDVTASTVDAAGNASSVTESFRVDTIGSVAINGGNGGADGIINAAEAAQGVTLTGTAEAGSTVSVKMGEITRQATVAADGTWTVTYTAVEVPQGTMTLPVIATATDVAGNITTANSSLNIDTESSVTINTAGVEGDGTINFAEASDGVILTGTAEAGSSVVVTMGTTSLMATVGADGSWSANFPSSAIPTGETMAAVSAVATDASGNSSTASGSIPVDTLVRNFAMTNNAGGADQVINAAEAEAGLVLNGTTEPGSTVTVTLDGMSRAATVDANGNWTVTYSGAEIPRGERAVTLSATSTDAAGNVDTVNSSVTVDTVANSLALSSQPIEGDGTINMAEASDGVILYGTSDAGAIVTVKFGTGTRTVVTDQSGNWQAGFTTVEIPADTSAAVITASTTDAAGNSRSVTGSVAIDTVVTNFATSTNPVEGDNVVNAAEASDGVIMTGTVEPGSTVNLTVNGTTVAATVDGAGNWTAGIPATALPTGEQNVTVTVNATDAAGNTATVSDDFDVDTLVSRLTTSATPVEGDDVVNAAEASDGVVLRGQVEEGSTVMVDFDGTQVAATVDAAGNWTANVPATAFRTGTYDASYTVYATDAAGNTDSITDAVAVDTDAPGGPTIASYTRELSGYSAISVDDNGDDLSVYEVHTTTGQTNQVGGDGTDFMGDTIFGFTPTIPDGSHLVVEATDDAGNTSGTYLVLDDTTTSVVDLNNPNLSVHQIENLDLQFAEESTLTIDEATITALSSNSDTLTVHGGHDDQITINGGTATGQTQVIDGQTYDVYAVGGATLVVDDDIQISTPII